MIRVRDACSIESNIKSLLCWIHCSRMRFNLKHPCWLGELFELDLGGNRLAALHILDLLNPAELPRVLKRLLKHFQTFVICYILYI